MAMAAAKGPGNATMADKVLVFYGSYRATRVGIRMASFVVDELRARGALPELIDAREIGLAHRLERLSVTILPSRVPDALEQ